MTCVLCGAASTREKLLEASWTSPKVLQRLAREHPDWRREDGACPACVQQALLQILLERGDAALHDGIQSAWPLDPEAAFGVLPTPLRLHADPRWTGGGVTLALVDSGFHPHPDLIEPRNRIRAWVDAGSDPVTARWFREDEVPAWPGSDRAEPWQWHGLMTSAAAAGNGRLSHGLYRGLASEADLVLVQARDAAGRITSAAIARALGWLRAQAGTLRLRVASLSVGGDAVTAGPLDPVDAAVESLRGEGVTVIAAAGNDGQRRLVPPASSPAALTVGGLDDKNTFDHAEVELWHGNYGHAVGGAAKPELVAPSIWVVAPLLPGTPEAARARDLIDRRAGGSADPAVEDDIARMKLVTPHYHHVDGTSVAAPLVASVAACMLQANPALTPRSLRAALLAACRPVPGAPRERQGAGALDAGQSLARALRERHGALEGRPLSPHVTPRDVGFLLHDHDVRQVEMRGSWDGWAAPGLRATLVEPGVWTARMPRPASGRHLYKFLLDGTRWLDDPDNPHKSPDGFGRLNSILTV